MNINSEQYVFKFGSLVQFGVDFMIGFSPFADEFVQKWNDEKTILDVYGYSSTWVEWQKINSTKIVELYDELNNQNLIP